MEVTADHHRESEQCVLSNEGAVVITSREKDKSMYSRS